MSAAGGLRSVESATRLGWVVLAGVALYYVAQFFKDKPIVKETPKLPPAPPADEATPPRPVEAAHPGGIVVGAKITTLRAAILEPAQGQRVDRKWLSSEFPATLEIINQQDAAALAQVEVVCDFVEFAGAERKGIRTLFPPISLEPGQVKQLEVKIESGNVQNLLADFAQAYCFATVTTNGKETQRVDFEVW